MESSTLPTVNTSADFNFTKNATAIYLDDVYSSWSNAEESILIVLYIIMIIVTGFGNVLTICAFVIFKQLRTSHNTYICNLAIADATVGFVCLPIYVYVSYGLDWDWTSLETWVCKFWLFADFTASNVGALSVGVISYDRYCLVAHGVKYMTSQTMFKVRVRCCFIWVSAVIVLAPGILFYDLIKGPQDEPWECLLEFRYDIAYMSIMIAYNFLIPLGMVAIFNFLVHLEIRKRSSMTGSVPEDNRLKRDKRAARSLTCLVLALIVCWLPWQIVTVLDIISKGYIPYAAWDICGMLFWFNSSINPVLYALTYPKFRQAFLKMLLPWKTVKVQDIQSTQTRSTNA